jgi:hypothetical protein
MIRHLPSLAIVALLGVAACSPTEKKLPKAVGCPEGQILLQGVCAVPLANCSPDGEKSIAGDCTAKNRVCFEDSLGALCGVCVPGFVADGDACRKRVGCADLGCEAKGRTCFANGDADATCGACVPGRAESGADCVAVTCDPSDPFGPAADCQAKARLCVQGDAGPTCGECFAHDVDDGGTCRAVRTCGDASCRIANRICNAEGLHADASCGDCRTGFRDDAGLCVRRTGTSCDATGADSLLAGCSAEHRGCAVAGDGSADCTTCTAGFAEDPVSGNCVADPPCGDLACGAQQRACETSPFGHCGACLAGFVEDRASGACRAAVTCSQLTCGDQQGCIEGGSGEDASCVPSCGPGTIRTGDHCASCPACDGPGEDGIETTLTQTGYCICKTKPGFFYSVSGDVGTFACDADGDGWVRESARNALSSKDPVLVKNAACQVRQIEAFTLQAEDGTATTVNLSRPLAMFETDRNDDDRLLAAILQATGIPPYGRTLHAAELNRLTKMCHTRRADYNDNGVADVEEWGDQDLAPTLRPEQRPFNQFSYFAELDTGRFVRSQQDPNRGEYLITERSRAATGEDLVPFTYTDPGDYWRTCTVKRDAEADSLSPPIGMDLASFQEQGFSGMNHHSQFKCMVIDEQPQRDVPSEISPSAALDYLDRGLALRLNRCTASGEPRAEERNPAVPSFTCSLVPDAQVQAGAVLWAAIPFLDYDPDRKNPGVKETDYVRGCVNECAEGRLHACFGWDTNPAAVQCLYDASDFGRFESCKSAELCDGFDNTGEGTVDEGNPGAGNACSNDGKPIAADLLAAGHKVATPASCAGNGDCANGFLCSGGKCVAAGVCTPGHTSCQEGQVVCIPDIMPGTRTEVCNVDGAKVPVDDDCDGTANESDPSDNKSCNTGQYGYCQFGTYYCDAAKGVETCRRNNDPLPYDLCSGTADYNCNGLTGDSDLDARPTYNAASASPCGTHGHAKQYLDSDNDNYGAGTPLCLCAPSGRGAGTPDALYRADNPGECCDTDASAKPGQTLWYGTADACNSYDYNCNGVEDKFYTTQVDGSCNGCRNKGSAGWNNVSPPACGSSGSWTTGFCSAGPAETQEGSCANDVACTDCVESRTQVCH